MPSRPSSAVLSAFGVTGNPVASEGGQGASWRVGDAVLKPLDVSEDELQWRADTYERIQCDGFRVAAPLRAADGALVVDGWTAAMAVSGRHEKRRWADRVAWGDSPAGAYMETKHVRAVIFRAVTDRILRPDAEHAPDDADPFMLPVALACRLAATAR